MPQNDWHLLPMKNVILHVLNQNHGVCLDNHLLKRVNSLRGTTHPQQLNKALMNLEIQGMVHVTQISKTKRKIELIKKDAQYLIVAED